MKKVVLFALILVCLCFGFKATVSAGELVADASVGKVTAERGDTVSVFVSVTGDIEAKALMVKSITYDTDALEFVRGSWLLDGAAISDDYNVDLGDAVIAFDAPVDINKDIFEIVFKVKSDAAYGVSNVSCNLLIQSEGTTGVIPITVFDGSVEVVCNHEYGSWTLISSPTVATTGLIKRVCLKDREHTETFTLPALSEANGYTYSVVTAPKTVTHIQ